MRRILVVRVWLALLSTGVCHAEDRHPDWYRAWVSGEILAQVEERFWLPEGRSFDEDLLRQIQQGMEDMKRIVPRFSFQEFTIGDIKWVAVSNRVGTTDPIYFHRRSPDDPWLIVLDQFRRDLPFTNDTDYVVMKAMFDCWENAQRARIAEGELEDKAEGPSTP